MSTLIALAKISLGAVSIAGVGTISAFAIKNNGFTGNHSNTISEPDQQDAGATTLPAKTLPNAVPPITVPNPQTPPPVVPQIKILAPQPAPTAPTKLSVVVVKEQAAPPQQTASQLTVSGASQSYKCRLKDVPPTDALSICKLVELSIPNKWIDLAGIKQATQSTPPSLESLKDATKQFKLEVAAELFDKVTQPTPKIVELVSDAASSVVHAELSTLFKLDGTTVDYENVSALLGRATAAYSSMDAAKQKQCPLTSTTALSTNHACAFKPFGSSTTTYAGAGYSKVTDVTIDAADSTSLTDDQYYFVNYSTPLTKSDLASLSKVYANEADTSAATHKATLDNVVPVIFNGAGDHKKAFILSETQTFKGVVVKTDSVTPTKSLIFNTQSKTYKCKYDSNEAADCELRLIPFTTDKTSHNTSDIKAITNSDTVTITDNTSTNSYYKVEVDSTFFNTFKAAAASKSIQILDETNGSKRLFTLDILYSIDENAEYEAESSYIVKTATLVTPPVNFTEGQKKYCLFATDESPDLSTAKECEIKDLGTSIDAKQSFTTTTNAASITAENAYLVTFVKTDGAALPTAKDIKDQSLLFLQVASADDEAVKTKVATFSKEHIDYALIVDADKNNKFAFVLDKPSSPT